MYSDDELLESLKRCYKKHGEVKTTLLNEDSNFPSAATYYTRFGSLDKALKRAGINDSTSNSSGRPTGNKYSDKELLNYLRECYRKYDLVNSTKLREDDSFPEPSNYWIRFSNLEEACNRAGVEYRYREDSFSEEELLEKLRKLDDEFGDTKTKTIQEEDGPSVKTYQTKFGSLVEAREEAGLSRTDYDKKFTQEELVQSLKEEFESQPTSIEIRNNNNLPNPKTFVNYFEGLKEAYKRAGLYEWQDGEKADVEEYDGYIYVIKLRRKIGGEIYYYIGQSTNSLKKRIQRHERSFSQSAPKKSKYGDIVSSSHDEYEYIELVNWKGYKRKDGENNTQFRKRLTVKEMRKSNEVAIEYDTVNVIGGR